MRKIIAMLSTLTITSSITPLTIVCNENKINKGETNNDSSKIEEIIVSKKEKKSESFNYQALNTWVNRYLIDDCLKNFGKHYRLKAKEFQTIRWKDIIKEFELFLYKKYDIKFKVEIESHEEDDRLIDGLNIKKIYVSLFKVDGQWKRLSSELAVHIWLNDAWHRLHSFKFFYLWNWHKIKQNPKDANEFISCLNKNSGKIFEVSDNIKFTLEDFFPNQLRSSHVDTKVKRCKFLANFIYMNLSLNNCFISISLIDFEPNFEEKIYHEYNIFKVIKDFIAESNFHINTKSKLLKFKRLASYTYQDFADYLNIECLRYLRFYKNKCDPFGIMVGMWLYPFLSSVEKTLIIKLSKNQDKVFTYGKNILELLILKNEKLEQYVEFHLPIYWYDEYKILEGNDYVLYSKYIIEKFNYPNANMIKSNELKEGQSKQSTYNLILEKIKDHAYGETEQFKMLNIEIINSDKLLKKGHNMVSVNFKADNFKFQVDFHINLIVS